MGQSFSAEPVVEKHTETDRNETFDAAVSSCQGWRFTQEDDHSLRLELPGEHKASFFAVFDGHGSAKVSKHAAESLWRHLIANELYIKGNFKEALEQSFLSFDREVFESYQAQLAGTTATSVLIVDNVIYCANIGDSRSVASINCDCVPLSRDHKPENPHELKRILAAGGYVLGNRVNGNLALSRAFGDFHYKSNEQLPADQQIVSPFPDIERIELNDDVDFIVLACDGIWDVLTSEEVVEFVISRLEHEVRPDQICEQLTTRCLATDYELVIGCDNMTVLLVCYTRGRSWSDYCTDIFNKNTKKLGLTERRRELDNNFGNDTTTFQHPNQRFDDTAQQSDHFGTSGSSDQSSGNPLNSTFANYDTSSSSDNDTSTTSGGLYLDATERRRAMDELFYLLQTGNLPNTAMNQPPDGSDEMPPISEVPAEEIETIHDDEETSAKTSDAPVDLEQAAHERTSPPMNTTTENEDSDERDPEANAGGAKENDAGKQTDESRQEAEADEVLISSKTAEINLDDALKNGDEDLPNESEIEPIDLATVSQADVDQTSAPDGDEQQTVQGTVEVELSAPDDNAEIDAGAAANESSEVDADASTTEAPTADSDSQAEPESEAPGQANDSTSEDT